MGKTIKNKCVSFNTEDKTQQAMLDYIEQRCTNFSAYVKTLIARDMEGDNAPNRPQKEKEPPIPIDLGSFI